MSNDGSAILECVQRLQDLVCDVALLLQQCDAALAPDWRPAVSTSSVSMLTGIGSLKNPRRWVPNMMCRSYSSSKTPGVMASVTVILDDPDRPKMLEEPLVSACCAKYAKDNVTYSDFHQCFMFAHLLRKDPKFDGCFRAFSDDELVKLRTADRKIKERSITAFSSMALPLVLVSGRETLQEKVIEPLLAEIRK